MSRYTPVLDCVGLGQGNEGEMGRKRGGREARGGHWRASDAFRALQYYVRGIRERLRKGEGGRRREGRQRAVCYEDTASVGRLSDVWWL